MTLNAEIRLHGSSRLHGSGGRLTAYGMPFRPTGFALLLLCLLGAAGVYWFGILSIADAWAKPEYSHGPLIPLISGYLFLRQMRHAPPIPGDVGERWTGVAVTGLGIVIGLVGNIAQIADIAYYGFIIWTWGVIMICFGRRRGALFWPPVLHLVFMLPLPNILYWKVSTYLQIVSSELGVKFISLMGIPVFLDGVIIDLGVYKLHVAEACSGLRYLFPVLSFSYIFAVLYKGPNWHKVVLLLSAGPITVVMNSLRIGVIGVIVNYVGTEWAEGFTHFFEGWVIFMTCVGILFGLAVLLQRFTANPQPLANTIDLDFEGLGQEIKRVFSVVPSAALATAGMLSVVAALSWHLFPTPTSIVPARESFATFPLQLDGRSGTSQALNPEVEAVLDATDYLSISYQEQVTRAPTSLFIAYYSSLTAGGGVHSPEVCLPGGGWEMSQVTPTTVDIETVDGPRNVVLNRAIIQNGEQQQLVYYWFDRGGHHVTSDWTLKFYSIFDRMTKGRNDGALVRLITFVNPSEGINAAELRLKDLLVDVLPLLPSYLPSQ